MSNSQKGFSLIELLLVVVIIGIISSIAIPNLLRATSVARNAGAYSMMRNLSTLQMNYFTVNNRYARLDEINAYQGSSLGELSGTSLIRGKFTFEMSPDPSPTDSDLKDGFEIKATKITAPGESPYVLFVNQTGVIIEDVFGAGQ